MTYIILYYTLTQVSMAPFLTQQRKNEERMLLTRSGLHKKEKMLKTHPACT